MQDAAAKRCADSDLFFDLSTELMCITDFDGRFLALNSAWEKAMGLTIEELKSAPYVSFVHPEDRENTLQKLAELTGESTNVSFEHRFRTQNSTYLWLEWKCTSNSARRRIFAVAKDVSEVHALRSELQQSRAVLEQRSREDGARAAAALQAEIRIRQDTEAALQHAYQTLNSIVSASPHAIIAVDRERNVRLWSSAAEKVFGWTSEEVLGHKVPFVTPDQQGESDLFNMRLLQGETAANYAMKRTRRDGQVVDLLVSAGPTFDEQGVLDGFLTVATDITEHKQLEQQLFRTQRLESLGTLASGIAHDLNNVLAPIRMALELFRMGCVDPSALRTLDIVDSCVQRGADLVRQVLTFARGVQGERVPVQTRHLMADLEKVISQTLPKSISIRAAVPADLWSVSADVTQLHQVLMNLCVNARDAMPDGGMLTLSARNVVLDESPSSSGESRKAYVFIEVADTGCGIPQEILQKIFEPFFTTKEIGKGTGLGLSTAAAIVKSHGGFINVYSEPARGTAFKLYIPALPGKESEAATKAAQALPVGEGELILIVDDEAAVRDIAKLTLEAHGYRVIEAQDGAEGVAVYAQRQNEIELVLSDMDMPIMSGAAMIRSLERINPKIRVISASGLPTDNKSRFPTVGTGPRVQLPKPYTAEELLRTVYSVIHSA